MKKVICSVIAVFSMQAGFIALTSLDRQTEDEAKATLVISGPTTETHDLIAVIAPTDIPELPDTADAAVPVPAIVSTARNVNSNRDRRNLSPKKVSAMTTARVTNFEPVVISLKPASVRPRPEQPQAVPARLDQSERQAFSAVTKPTKKRSFFSKSLSIIKAPYRWIRSLGSKMM